MNFALNELHVTILNLLLVGVLAIFLGLSLEDVYKFHVAGEVMPATFVAARPLPLNTQISRRPRIFYNAITDRDIFDLAPAPAAVEHEDLQIHLIGTSLLTTGKPFAIIENQSGQESLYRKGDQIVGVGQLLEIEKDRAIILHDGHRVAVEIPRDQPAPVPIAPPPPRHRGLKQPMPLARAMPAPGGVHRIAPNRFLLARSTVDADLQNPAPLFTQIRAIPDMQDGAPRGFRLSEIEPGSVFQQIGLQDGDLLTNVSGQPVGDPMKALAMFQTLHGRSSVTLNVIRAGQPVQLYYSIR